MRLGRVAEVETTLKADWQRFERIRHNLRVVREAGDITQKRLSRAIGRCDSYVALVECGFRRPSTLALLRLAAALGVTVSTLVGDD